MTGTDNSEMRQGEISLNDLMATLARAGQAPLVFHCDGHPLRSGYHVTEVKAGQFSALDCGANPEAWSEIFIQLWDVDEGAGQPMTAGKFQAIIGKVLHHVTLDRMAKLTFEVSDGFAPMQLYHAAMPALDDGVVHVALRPRAASCKPRDRWLAGAAPAEAKTADAPSACCGAARPEAAGKACCA